MKKSFAVLFSLMVIFTIGIAPNKPVFAATNLTVDCGDKLRAVTHCASGSLYGVTETTPTDITNLVMPLNPNVFTNPALAGTGYQQPIGAAIPVTGRLTGTTGKVMIRLADIFPNWPYSFTNMTDWLSKVTSVIRTKKVSGYSNVYGYEIWNEPVYTWTSTTVTYNEMWFQTYNLIRSLDSNAQIIGPSEGYYNHSKMNTFLSFCKANHCLPDIICWHELGGNGIGVEGVSNDIKDCVALESTLGISAKKISINEYCDANHDMEGQPGSSASFIAKFERNKVDSACISWWFTAHPGRLGSLMASDTQKGAGWWFYKWYGDMTGNMVNVTPPNDVSKEADGSACVDSSAKYISVLLGGVNDGNINVKINNIPSFIGSTATVKVEKVDWVNKNTPVSGTSTISTANYTVSNGSINVSIAGTNNTSGYRVYVTPGISNTQTLYEAENADISSAKIFSSTNASNGKYVGKIDCNNTNTPVYSYVDFTVNVPTTKTYTMAIRYANGNGSTSTQGLAYNGGIWSTISYPATASWMNFASVNTSVNLKAGFNTIRLAKGSPYFVGGTGDAELDYIEVK